MAQIWPYDVDAEAFTLQWKEIAGAKRYELEWRVGGASGCDGAAAATAAAAATDDDAWASGSARVKSAVARKKGLTPGRAYAFRVRGVDELGEALPGGFSAPTEPLVLASGGARPAAPKLSARDAESVTVVWPDADGVLFHAQMRVAGAGAPWTTCSDKLGGKAMRKRGLVANTKYEFRVAAAKAVAAAAAAVDGEWGPWSPPSAPLAIALLAPCFGQLLGPQLLSSGGAMVPSESAAGGMVALYFSAHWCPPCRQFTPMLADFYRAVRQRPLGALKSKLEVVFVSADRDAHAFAEYFAEQPWLAVPYTAPQRERISATYQVQGIPCLKIFSAAGKLLCDNAAGQPLNDAAVRSWESKM
jgi:thiol-disulfide isomerase/thioredoxin